MSALRNDFTKRKENIPSVVRSNTKWNVARLALKLAGDKGEVGEGGRDVLGVGRLMRGEK